VVASGASALLSSAGLAELIATGPDAPGISRGLEGVDAVSSPFDGGSRPPLLPGPV